MRINLFYDGYTYYYKASTNKIKAKMETADWYNATHRIVNDLHGIQLAFAQSGGVRLPDFKTMLLTLVSGLVMLSTAKTVADYFLLYAAPKRADYRLFVEQLSPDFGPDNDAERMLLEKILARKRRERNELLGKEEPFLAEGTPNSAAVAPGAAGAQTMQR